MKGVSNSSTFKSLLRPSPESKMEISIASDVTHQPSTTSPSHRPAAVATTTAEDPVLDQFQQMRSMISSFLVQVRTLLQDQDSRSAIISTRRLNTCRSKPFLNSVKRQ